LYLFIFIFLFIPSTHEDRKDGKKAINELMHFGDYFRRRKILSYHVTTLLTELFYLITLKNLYKLSEEILMILLCF
jgi:hypothetical protein